MKIFSTFSGIGGFEVGIQNAVLNFPYDKLPEFVGCSEIDKYAASVYEKHFGGIKNYGDITKIKADELPDFDCLVGGFPCQAFSIAGKRMGFQDTRGTLFYDLTRILQAKRPRLLVFENVKGLLSHDGGRTFKEIICALAELGYNLQWQVLNSKDFGVPQNRERVIIVGHLGEAPRPQVFPIVRSESNLASGNQKEEGQIANTISARYGSGNGRGPHVEIGVLRTHNDGRGFRKNQANLCPTIPARARARTDGSSQPIIVQTATKQGYDIAYKGDSINLAQPNSKTRRGRVGKGVANTITTQQEQYTINGEHQIRRLTPLECERLQGFPDDWTKFGVSKLHEIAEISDSQRYKMCGNAVTTNVIQAVFKRIFKSEISLEKEDE